MKKKTNSTTIKIRINNKEKEAAQVQAEAAGLSLSALTRALLAGVQIRTKADAAVLGELRRLGGLVKKAFTEGVDPQATSAALKVLEQAAARLAR